MQVICYYDYICPYSYRAFQWLTRLEDVVEEFTVRWATFSLKEANRDPDTASPFDDPDISSVSVLALALAHAARAANFDRYHAAAFEGMNQRRLSEPDLLALAATAEVDVSRFDSEHPRFLQAVAREHRHARARWQVFGTPTIIIADDVAVYLKLAALPDPASDAEVWRSICTLSLCHPELVEIKRPPSPSSHGG